MTIRYRKATMQDENELFHLAKQLATSFTVNQKDFAKVLPSLLQNRDVDIIVAEQQQQLVGYVLAFHHPAFYANGTVSWVEELYVTEECRGKAVGKRLMQEIEEAAKERGSKLMALATRRAADFYQAIGYEKSATYFKKTFAVSNSEV
ncbi:GNAT family N-acetyltransferase [Gracilibacillus alcaliphilus]|uniref:GNAT family N-acetyltransferase n=1 Tax=Gracilibacillus alcaliphilus TaxID=1401441 RepID=UPI0019588A34|nr:GNAT family N-acetyltransferase [Gracilibacillus alcaliphilus]MBM7677597.1 GNAT superfamily N-acetyltransferase [Gracilibacillus alcaliphilus]